MTTLILSTSIRHTSSFNNVIATSFRRGATRSNKPFLKSKQARTFLPPPSSSVQEQNYKAGYSYRYVSSNKNEYKPFTNLMMEADTSTSVENEVKTSWDIAGLKKETARLTLRCHKKIGKANTRLSKANEQVEEIRTNPDATLEELEQCPNIKIFEDEVTDLRNRLQSLTLLEEKLKSLKGKNIELPDDILSLVQELDVNDEPPKRQQRPKKKKKGPRTMAPRLPYFKYYSENNTEIRVS